LSVHDEEAIVDAALAAGARAYVIKERAAEELMPAIREALEGRIYIS
jgi:DNA-binding NarL/FixJ family response regulator